MARPSTQAKRRDEILDAAQKLLLRSDTAAVRIADVAAELDMTPNAVRYYYRDVEGLMAELSQRGNERFYTRRLTAIEDVEDPALRLAMTISAGIPTGPDDAEWRVTWRAVLAAGFELNRTPTISEIYHRQVGLYQSVLDVGAALGTFTLSGRSIDIARTIMSLEDYLGYRIVARDRAFDRQTALRLIREYAELATRAALPPSD